MAERILRKEFKSLAQEKWINVELHNDDILMWDIALIVINSDSLYYAGYFLAKMCFPKNYPYLPPSRLLLQEIIPHDPNFELTIYQRSNLFGPSAIRTFARMVESVSQSFILLKMTRCLGRLLESVGLQYSVSNLYCCPSYPCSTTQNALPANVDAGLMLRTGLTAFKAKVKADVEASKKDIPPDFAMPTYESTVKAPVPVKDDDVDFWMDSDQEDNLRGSDTGAIAIDSGVEEGEDDDLHENGSPDEGNDDYDVLDMNHESGGDINADDIAH